MKQNIRQHHPMLVSHLIILFGILFVGGFVAFTEASEKKPNVLRLESAVQAAQSNDPWLIGNKHTQDSFEAKSVAAGTLPDPKLSMALANLPTDTFNFDQEPMTQLRVGMTQMFPRGDSLELKKKQLEVMSRQFPFQRQDRRARVVVAVSGLWLDAYKAQESIALIEKDRPLFEQLADVAEASYSSALGRTRQQDIIRAQLELTRLDDRLTILRQQQEMFIERLSEWLSDYFIEEYISKTATTNSVKWSQLILDRDLPSIQMLKPSLYKPNQEADPQTLYRFFSQHPVVLALDKKIEATAVGIDLANQKYKPEWGVNASYAYRDADRQGRDLPDFVSVGLTFDLPFFTKNRQDKELESAVSEAESVKTEKWLLVRKMIAGFEKTRTQLSRLNERQSLYQNQLLPQMEEQAEASLTAYTNDDGDFAEVVRARIAELNAQIAALVIDVERQKAIINLNYFFMKSADDIITSN